MLTTAYLDRLVQIYSSGTLSGTYQGRAVSFTNGDDLRKRIRDVAAGLGVRDPLLSVASAPRMSVVSMPRG